MNFNHRYNTMSLKTIIFLIVNVALVTCKPYMLLQTSQFKCLQTFESEETELYIEYEIPDLVILPGDDSSKMSNPFSEKEKKEEIKPESITTREELMKYRESRAAADKDTLYNQRTDRKLDMAAQIHKSSSSSINVKISEKEPYWNDEPMTDSDKEFQLKKASGYEKYQVNYDGIVEICFQSLTASSMKPVRLHVRISDQPPKHIRRELSTNKLKTGLSSIGDQIESMTSEVQQILRDSDMLKDFEQEVRTTNAKLYKATLLWPCMRIGLFIVIFGFGSSLYLVGLFRKHGLIE